MEGWTTTSWAAADWALLANLNDFVDAVQERNKALNNGAAHGSITTRSAGDDVQAASWWLAIQEFIEAVYSDFAVCADAGSMRASGYYNNSDGVDVYANLAALFSAAGLATSTWRAYTTHPDDPGADQGRKIQAGDIIGSWLFEDLQAVLNVLVWTKVTGSWTDQSENSQRRGNSDVGGLPWADAKTGCVTDWNGNAAYGGGSYPYAWTAGDDFGGGSYQARAGRGYGYGTISSIWTGLSRAVEWYNYATDEGFDTFADMGDEVYDAKWRLWHTDAPAGGTSTLVSGQVVGTVGTFPPTWCATPAPFSNAGYEATANPVGLVRWNVASGFTYTL